MPISAIPSFLAALVCLLACFPQLGAAEVLSLSDYLQQVRHQNEEVKGADLKAVGQKERAEEGALPTAISAFSNLTYSIDARPQLIPLLGTRITTTELQLGVSKVWDFGLQSRLYQQIISTSTYGAVPLYVPVPAYIDSAPVLELTQSLWRNGFGSETRATQVKTDAQALRDHYNNTFLVKQDLATAENAYWQLALARQMLDIQNDTLERSRQIRVWSERRTERDLADRADLLQADAAYRLQELQVKQAQDDLRVATRAFNSARGVDSDSLDERLQAIDSDFLDALAIPPREKLRDDVKAAQQNQLMADADTILGREKNNPTLDVFADYSLTGRDPVLPTSLSSSYDYQHPYTMIGLRFVAPLDISLIEADRAGYFKEQQAAELLLSRKLFEQENLWKDLLRKFQEARERMTLAAQIEQAQRIKAEHEKDRLARARTTFFQVLQFELDYNAARVNHLRIAGDMLAVIAQMKTFGGSHDSR
jgi:outer membrane protein TolC